jgi:hypothetical protein
MKKSEAKLKTLMKALALSTAIIMNLAVVVSSRAAVVFTILSGGDGITATGNDALKFTANTDILVDALGYYDFLRDGFQFSHDVGIFDSLSQVLLASVTITSTDTVIGDFRYASITPLALEAGRSYLLVGHATQSSVDRLAFPDSLRVDAAVTYEGYFYNFDSALTFPTLSSGAPAIGPNFNILVPEPSTTQLGAAGVCGVFVRRVRRRQNFTPDRLPAWNV